MDLWVGVQESMLLSPEWPYFEERIVFKTANGADYVDTTMFLAWGMKRFILERPSMVGL